MYVYMYSIQCSHGYRRVGGIKSVIIVIALQQSFLDYTAGRKHTNSEVCSETSNALENNILEYTV